MACTTRRIFPGLIIFALIISGSILSSLCQAQTTQPKTVKQASEDLNSDMQKMRELMGPHGLPTDPAERTGLAPKIIPAIHQIITDLDVYAVAQPEAKEEIEQARQQFRMMLAAFGDKSSLTELQNQANSKDPVESLQAKGDLLTIQWFDASKDAGAQSKVADELESLAKSHSDSDPLTRQLMLVSEMGPASVALANRISDVLVNVMKSPQATAAQQSILQARKMKEMEGKPLVISGTQVDGRQFSTADWKGKVILVDFWATWCGPCKEELPRVKKAYADFHSKGLEVLGVSNDYAANDLTQFLAQDKEMPWPQLFDTKAAAEQSWNPITVGFGINGIPTMFLIDKEGILHSTDARADFEDEIPKLLAE